jgi:hypothetical protein
MSTRFRALLAQLFPLFLVMGLSMAAPAHAWGGNTSSWGSIFSWDDNNQGDEDGGPGPAIPEPSAWLAMGVGLLVVGPYARKHFRAQR